jgi:hypothetical protein
VSNTFGKTVVERGFRAGLSVDANTKGLKLINNFNRPNPISRDNVP